MMTETIYTEADVLSMLDHLLQETRTFNWDSFYANRNREIPFFVNAPDENLVQYLDRNWLPIQGKVLELGCGPGRNAIYLARHGYAVDAVDLSEQAIRWGEERAYTEQVNVCFAKKNIFALRFDQPVYDIVYDSGCFHHIAPHRRPDYVRLINEALKPGGFFGLTCFVPDGNLGGSTITDWEVYRQRGLCGGLGYTPEKLKAIFNQLRVVELRTMKDIEQPSDRFGVSGLWTALFQKNMS